MVFEIKESDGGGSPCRLYFYYMKKSQNSSFLLTEQSRYSEDLFAKSINRVRRRINILSTTTVGAEHLCP